MSIEVSFSNVLLLSDVRGREKSIELTFIAKKMQNYCLEFISDLFDKVAWHFKVYINLVSNCDLDSLLTAERTQNALYPPHQFSCELEGRQGEGVGGGTPGVRHSALKYHTRDLKYLYTSRCSYPWLLFFVDHHQVLVVRFDLQFNRNAFGSWQKC